MTQNVISAAGETNTTNQGRGWEVHFQRLRRDRLEGASRHETCNSLR
jgi:hypothetical protein